MSRISARFGVSRWSSGALIVGALLLLAVAPTTAEAADVQLSTTTAARAVAVSEPLISVHPVALDYGFVTIGTSETRAFTVRNTGVADLVITNILSSDSQVTTNQPIPTTLSPGDSLVDTATYTPTGGTLDGTIAIQSNAINGTFTVVVRGQANHAPVIDPIAPISSIAWIPLQFTAHASDADGDPVSFSADGLPAGAAFDATGTFSWTPTADDGGAHTVTITASDGHTSASTAVTITVAVLNHLPVAVPGGPYTGTTGVPVSFDGSGSHDPDGNTLVFHWTFGDGTTGSGEQPSHTYAHAGGYTVTLEVVDDGTPNLSGTALTVATISTPMGTHQVTLRAVQDNNIYSESDSSYGAGRCLQVGRPLLVRPGGPLIRRALLRFDLSSIPAGSKIFFAQLNLFRFALGGPGSLLRVHRLNQDWGEGNSGAGDDCQPPPRVFGNPPTDSSSTWNYAFFGTRTVWSEAGQALHGGNFQSSPSDSELISSLGQNVGLTSGGIMNDVSDWVRNPSSNHGWILLGDELNLGTGMRFASREDTVDSHPPSVTISFTPPMTATLNLDPDVINLRSRSPWITAYIGLSEGSPANIDVTTLRLAGSIPPDPKTAKVGDLIGDDALELMVKFSRAALDPLLTLGMNDLTITGSLVTGEPIQATDRIRVMDPSRSRLVVSAYPNPLRGSGTVQFTTTRPGPARLAIFDVRGSLVRVLMDTPSLEAGRHTIPFDGFGKSGHLLPSGVYFYKIVAAEGTSRGRIVVSR